MTTAGLPGTHEITGIGETMNSSGITVAGETLNQDEAMNRLVRYWSKTPPAFDYPGPGRSGTLTREEVVRTRKISSRISNDEVSFFLEAASTAPWIGDGSDADLEHADPATGGLFPEMTDLYWHFAGSAPRGVSFAKISKVLHLKYPGLYPILDSHVRRSYAPIAKQLRGSHSELAWRRRTWVAVRGDLMEARESGAMTKLRGRLNGYRCDDPAEQERVRGLNALTDLRLLDILVW